MFVCVNCIKPTDRHSILPMSRGPCEICHEVSECYEVYIHLPEPHQLKVTLEINSYVHPTEVAELEKIIRKTVEKHFVKKAYSLTLETFTDGKKYEK